MFDPQLCRSIAMSRYDLARLILRLEGAAFLFWALIDITHLGPTYNEYLLMRDVPDLELSSMSRNTLKLAMFRLGMQLMVAFMLLAGTDRVISFFIQGKKSLGRKISEEDVDSSND